MSGWNLPDGVTSAMVEDSMAEPPCCWSCADGMYLCLDHGVCGRELAEALGAEARPADVVEWCERHLRDLQGDVCDLWRGEGAARPNALRAAGEVVAHEGRRP